MNEEEEEYRYTVTNFSIAILYLAGVCGTLFVLAFILNPRIINFLFLFFTVILIWVGRKNF